MTKQRTTHIYGKKTAIRDVMDRLDYITNPKRQNEKLIATAGNMDKEFWQRLAKKNRQESKNTKKTNNGQRRAIEAIEIIVNLPNEVLTRSAREQLELMESLYVFTVSKTGTDCAIGMHDSHKGNVFKPGNCHVHILIADRPLLPEVKENISYNRNIYLDEKGKKRRTKKEILNDDGTIREGCKIVLKGEKWKDDDIFGSKYRDMSTKHWLHRMKQNYCYWINETLEPDLVREVYDPETSLYIPYVHIPKGISDKMKFKLEQDNDNIRKWNNAVRKGDIIYEEEAIIYRDLIALSPDKADMLLNIYRRIQLKVDGGMEYSAKDILNEQKREEYRQARINRNLAKEAKTESEKEKYYKIAAGHSANIDRIDQSLGNWKPERYYQEIRNAEIELEKLTSKIEEFRYWMSVLAKRNNEESKRRYREYRRMLRELENGQQALAREIAANKDRWELANGEEKKISKFSFDKIVKSAELRREARRVVGKDYSKPSEAYFGPTDIKRQAVIDSIQIWEKEGLKEVSERQNIMDNIAISMVHTKTTVDTTSRVLEMEEKKRQLVIEYEKLVKIRKYIELFDEKDRREIEEDYAQELSRLSEVEKQLKKVGIFDERTLTNYKSWYNRVYNTNAKNKKELEQIEEEYLYYRNIRNTFIKAKGWQVPAYEEGKTLNYIAIQANMRIEIDYEHTPPEEEEKYNDWVL